MTSTSGTIVGTITQDKSIPDKTVVVREDLYKGVTLLGSTYRNITFKVTPFTDLDSFPGIVNATTGVQSALTWATTPVPTTSKAVYLYELTQGLSQTKQFERRNFSQETLLANMPATYPDTILYPVSGITQATADGWVFQSNAFGLGVNWALYKKTVTAGGAGWADTYQKDYTSGAAIIKTMCEPNGSTYTVGQNGGPTLVMAPWQVTWKYNGVTMLHYIVSNGVCLRVVPPASSKTTRLNFQQYTSSSRLLPYYGSLANAVTAGWTNIQTDFYTRWV